MRMCDLVGQTMTILAANPIKIVLEDRRGNQVTIRPQETTGVLRIIPVRQIAGGPCMDRTDCY